MRDPVGYAQIGEFYELDPALKLEGLVDARLSHDALTDQPPSGPVTAMYPSLVYTDAEGISDAIKQMLKSHIDITTVRSLIAGINPLVLPQGSDSLYGTIASYWTMAGPSRDIAALRSQVERLRNEIRDLRGLQPQIVYVEEVPFSDAKERVVKYFEEHSEADLEDLMINLKIPVRILVDVIDELREEGTLSSVGEE